ncbi:hypothetical protein FSP39_001632 [Pinctada imbricata]|uniref:Uncharacterized protein n=1 Tax=Pinctada imbricata TaxID=66713 RepID=A0AA89CD21_PINIB|nr:hypothetical protein FSP39_001632 [Pinctada imbricata]
MVWWLSGLNAYNPPTFPITKTSRRIHTNGECSAILRPRIPGDMIVGKRSGTVCKLCCHDDYCNSEICDLPGVDKTGPRCLSCNDAKLDRPQDCLSITQCAKDEVSFHYL